MYHEVLVVANRMTVDYISSTSLLLRLLIGIGSVHFVASAMILHVSPSAGDSPCSLEAPCNIAVECNKVCLVFLRFLLIVSYF